MRWWQIVLMTLALAGAVFFGLYSFYESRRTASDHDTHPAVIQEVEKKAEEQKAVVKTERDQALANEERTYEKRKVDLSTKQEAEARELDHDREALARFLARTGMRARADRAARAGGPADAGTADAEVQDAVR